MRCASPVSLGDTGAGGLAEPLVRYRWYALGLDAGDSKIDDIDMGIRSVDFFGFHFYLLWLRHGLVRDGFNLGLMNSNLQVIFR